MTITKKNVPFVIFIIGTVTAIAIVTTMLIFFNPPECPSYTMPQGSNCVIGANIGLGLYLLLAIGLWVIANAIATLLAVRNIFLNKSLTKNNRVIKSVLIIFIASLVTYAVVSLFLNHMSSLGRS
jgi:hypothetical protein